MRPGLELRERRAPQRRARPLGDEAPEDLQAAVLGVSEQHLVAGPSASERMTAFSAELAFVAKTRSSGRRADVGGQLEPRRVEQRRKAPLERQELDRLALELALQRLVGLEYGPRAGAERAVVQVDDARIEEEKILHSP